MTWHDNDNHLYFPCTYSSALYNTVCMENFSGLHVGVSYRLAVYSKLMIAKIKEAPILLKLGQSWKQRGLGPIPFTKRIVSLTLGGEDAFNPILALGGEAHKVQTRLWTYLTWITLKKSWSNFLTGKVLMNTFFWSCDLKFQFSIFDLIFGF